jgi:hypothetical protein
MEKLFIHRFKFAKFSGNIILVVDRFNGADRLACAAIHTLIWLDVEHPAPFVDAIYGALFNA